MLNVDRFESVAKLLREMAEDCADPALRAQALERATEIEALPASCICAARSVPHVKGDPGCMYQPGTFAWARAKEPRL